MKCGDANATYVLSFDRDLDGDAVYMFATLATVALWNGTEWSKYKM